MVYIKMKEGRTAYIFSDKIKSITYSERGGWAKVCYADGDVVTYVDVFDVTIKDE